MNSKRLNGLLMQMNCISSVPSVCSLIFQAEIWGGGGGGGGRAGGEKGGGGGCHFTCAIGRCTGHMWGLGGARMAAVPVPLASLQNCLSWHTCIYTHAHTHHTHMQTHKQIPYTFLHSRKHRPELRWAKKHRPNTPPLNCVEPPAAIAPTRQWGNRNNLAWRESLLSLLRAERREKGGQCGKGFLKVLLAPCRLLTELLAIIK